MIDSRSKERGKEGRKEGRGGKEGGRMEEGKGGRDREAIAK